MRESEEISKVLDAVNQQDKIDCLVVARNITRLPSAWSLLTGVFITLMEFGINCSTQCCCSCGERSP